MKKVFEKIKELWDDHSEEIILGIYAGFMVVITGMSVGSLRYYNENMKLQNEVLRKHIK